MIEKTLIDSLKLHDFNKLKRGAMMCDYEFFTNEIGLNDKSGFVWQHITYLIDQCGHHAKI